MLSVNQIAALVRHQAFDRLFERVVANGRHMARETRLHLVAPADLVPAAIGLGLIRVSELTWRPHRAGHELVLALRDRQRADGLFSSAGPGSAIGTAVALLGLRAWQGLLGECRPLCPKRAPGPARPAQSGLVPQDGSFMGSRTVPAPTPMPTPMPTPVPATMTTGESPGGALSSTPHARPSASPTAIPHAALADMIDRASRALATCGSPAPIVVLTPGQLVLTLPARQPLATPATAA